MPKLERWANFPKNLRQHLIQRMADRSITLEDLNQQRLWVESNPEVPRYISRWSLKGRDPDGKEIQMKGTSSDILRRQADGRWLIVLDNPWGAALLDKSK